MAIADVAEDWLRWGMKGTDGFCGRLDAHARQRRLTDEERRMIESVVRRLQLTLAEDAKRATDAA